MWPKEKQFANLLTKQKKKWIYHPRHFDLYPHFRHYEPDFYLPKEDKYIEVVGTRQAYHSNKDKYQILKKLYPNVNLLILTWEGKPFIAKDRRFRLPKGSYISVKISSNLHKKLKELSYKENCSISYLGSKALRNYLRAKKIQVN